MDLIGIVDGDESRALAIAKKISNCSEGIELYLFKKGGWRRYDSEGDSFCEMQYFNNTLDLALIHYRNDERQVGIKRITIEEEIRSLITIWYGGKGAEPEKGKKWNINVILKSSEDVKNAISLSDMSEMISWALLEESKRWAIALPRLLRVPLLEIIPALAILCQGYLVVSSIKSDKSKRGTKEALEMMGWLDFVKTEEGKELAAAIKEKGKQFTDVRKWKDLLRNLDKMNLKKRIDYELDLKEEDPNNEIELLLNVIYGKGKNGKERDQSQVIAEAYIKFANELKRIF